MMQYDLFQADAQKQRGIGLATLGNEQWMDEVVALARQHLPTGEIMGEDVRRILAPLIGEPKNPGAMWGAVVNRLRYLRILRPTGRYAKSTAVGNHSHKYEIYIR